MPLTFQRVDTLYFFSGRNIRFGGEEPELNEELVVLTTELYVREESLRRTLRELPGTTVGSSKGDTRGSGSHYTLTLRMSNVEEVMSY